jgi:hypothetical protein
MEAAEKASWGLAKNDDKIFGQENIQKINDISYYSTCYYFRFVFLPLRDTTMEITEMSSQRRLQ